jgi:hypothetical protein
MVYEALQILHSDLLENDCDEQKIKECDEIMQKLLERSRKNNDKYYEYITKQLSKWVTK